MTPSDDCTQYGDTVISLLNNERHLSLCKQREWLLVLNVIRVWFLFFPLLISFLMLNYCFLLFKHFSLNLSICSRLALKSKDWKPVNLVFVVIFLLIVSIHLFTVISFIVLEHCFVVFAYIYCYTYFYTITICLFL